MNPKIPAREYYKMHKHIEHTACLLHHCQHFRAIVQFNEQSGIRYKVTRIFYANGREIIHHSLSLCPVLEVIPILPTASSVTHTMSLTIAESVLPFTKSFRPSSHYSDLNIILHCFHHPELARAGATNMLSKSLRSLLLIELLSEILTIDDALASCHFFFYSYSILSMRSSHHHFRFHSSHPPSILRR